jgi:hypothetical protein
MCEGIRLNKNYSGSHEMHLWTLGVDVFIGHGDARHSLSRLDESHKPRRRNCVKLSRLLMELGEGYFSQISKFG